MDPGNPFITIRTKKVGFSMENKNSKKGSIWSITKCRMCFKEKMVIFIDELLQIHNSREFVKIKAMLKSEPLVVVKMLDLFVKYLIPCEKEILNKDEKFFLEDKGLFAALDKVNMSKVDYFKGLWSSRKITKDNKEIIWKWFNRFLKLSKLYRKASQEE